MKRLIFVTALACAAIWTLGVIANADTEVPNLIGTNERLVLVIAGDFATQAEATAANDAFHFGDVQGFYLAPSDVFLGMTGGRWLLVSAFRTDLGASQFEELANAAGATSLTRAIATYLGTESIGLGQEPHPDGTGPLLGPLPDGHPSKV